MDAEVLVVGAGPTGLMFANQLARRGVCPRIIDRHAGPSVQTRALGVQARTLEIYAHLGIAGRAIDLGRRASGANIWALGRPEARIPLGDIGRELSPYPFLLILGQDDNERLLGDVLRAHDLDVEWKTELVGLTQEADHVRARLKGPDGATREITAGWVAGCDGARSSVREFNDMSFPGAPYEQVFFVADVEVTGTMVPDELNVYLWRHGFHLFFPMRGADHWRIIGILPPALRDRDDVDFDDVVPSMRQEAGAGLSFRRCTWFSTYRIHHRRAARFRNRRCFLLGDAAHIHSPVGAQGMNTGLQDAYNLAWKLALVVTGRAAEPLLDSYELERIPVAQRVLDTTDRAFSLVVSDNRIVGLLRTRVLVKLLAFAMRFERVQRTAFRTVSQIGIHYRDQSGSATGATSPATGPQAGDRMPWLQVRFQPGGALEDLFERLDDTCFNLILIGQPGSDADIPELADLLRIHSVPDQPDNIPALDRAGIARPSFYLLRPDGHVGVAGAPFDADAVATYLSRHVRLLPTRA